MVQFKNSLPLGLSGTFKMERVHLEKSMLVENEMHLDPRTAKISQLCALRVQRHGVETSLGDETSGRGERKDRRWSLSLISFPGTYHQISRSKPNFPCSPAMALIQSGDVKGREEWEGLDIIKCIAVSWAFKRQKASFVSSFLYKLRLIGLSCSLTCMNNACSRASERAGMSKREMRRRVCNTFFAL